MLDFEGLRDIDSSIVFDFEEYIRLELNIKMDRPSDSPEQTHTGGQEGICRFFQKGFCAKGQNCPYRHISGSSGPKNERTIVCKHWLRGLCKKGDLCEFL
jgi:cleavage and polyadenylation specificity factor subunit 4